jgi:hypothetical protein
MKARLIMNDFDIDKLLGENLGGRACRDEFRKELLASSAKALVAAAVIRRRMKIAGTFLVICVVAAGAFVCGRFSAIGQTVQSGGGEVYTAKNIAGKITEPAKYLAMNEGDDFWRTKILVSLQARPSLLSKTYESNANLLERYRQYIREKNYQ